MGKGGEFNQARLEQNENWTLSLLPGLSLSTSFFPSAPESKGEGGWREVWDCLRGKEAGERFWIAWERRRLEGYLGCTCCEGAQTTWGVTCTLSRLPALFTTQVHLAPGFRGNCWAKGECSHLGLNEVFPKFSPEKMPRVYTTWSWLSWALVLAAEINHSGLCLAPLFAIQLVPFEIQMIGIRILAGERRM